MVKRQEVLIAVMGVTGAGKSSFVKLITGNPNVRVGHSLHAGTSEVHPYSFTYKNVNFVIVDTPGFDDRERSDMEVLRTLHKWLEDSYRQGRKLTSILYLHRINNVRMQGSAMKNLYMFQKLCGKECFGNVVLGTTFWSTVTNNRDLLVAAEAREKELISNDDFWGEMVKAGSEVVRISDDQVTARELLLRLAKKNTITLKAQAETVHGGKTFDQTSAAQSMKDIVARMEKEHQEELARKRKEYKRRLEEEDQKRKEEEAKFKRDFEERLKKQREEEERRKEEQDRRDRELKLAQEEAKRVAERLAQEKAELEKKMAEMKISRANAERARRNKQHRNHVTNCMELLAEGMNGGKVLFNMREATEAYLGYCDNCMKNIGSAVYYTCEICDGGDVDEAFWLCDNCHSETGVYCDDRDHFFFMSRREITDRQGGCARVISPPAPNSVVTCSRCFDDCGSVYLHCCACDNDNFDMCLKCALGGRTCKKSWSIRGHPLDICARYKS